MTLRAYALAVGLGKSHSFAYRVARGDAAPPLKALGRWAEPLGLSAAERARFELLAGIANSPPVVREWFAKVDRTPKAPAKRRV